MSWRQTRQWHQVPVSFPGFELMTQLPWHLQSSKWVSPYWVVITEKEYLMQTSIFFLAKREIICIIPPPNGVLVGYTVFSMSMIPKFRYSVNIWGVYSITLIAFVRVCSLLQHTLTIRQCMFDRKKGAETSVLQELWYFVILTIRCLYYDW